MAVILLRVVHDAALVAWMLVARLPVVERAHQLTSDLKLPVWPFYAVLTAGIVATAVVAGLRVVELAEQLAPLLPGFPSVLWQTWQVY